MRLIKNKFLHTLLLFSILLAGTLILSCGSTLTAGQKAQKALRIKEKVESSDFTFKAETAIPTKFKPIHLTSSYELKVSKDMVTAYLPYFGRAYVAPIDPSEGGIKFTSTDFKYRFVYGKHPGNWKVTIKTSIKGRSMTLFLEVWENGTAQLTVDDPDRQTISFDGYIVD